MIEYFGFDLKILLALVMLLLTYYHPEILFNLYIYIFSGN
jgi:hypothetical protein